MNPIVSNVRRWLCSLQRMVRYHGRNSVTASSLDLSWWPRQNNLKAAAVAFIVQVIYVFSAQYRTLALLKTVGTKPVRWLAVLVLWLKHVNKDSNGKFLKAVTCCLGVPLLVSYELLFGLTFNIGQLLILGLNGKYLGLKVNDVVLDARDCLLHVSITDSLRNACDQFDYVIRGGECRGDFSDGHNVVMPNLSVGRRSSARSNMSRGRAKR